MLPLKNTPIPIKNSTIFTMSEKIVFQHYNCYGVLYFFIHFQKELKLRQYQETFNRSEISDLVHLDTFCGWFTSSVFRFMRVSCKVVRVF